jgi:hypothetical protein
MLQKIWDDKVQQTTAGFGVVIFAFDIRFSRKEVVADRKD